SDLPLARTLEAHLVAEHCPRTVPLLHREVLAVQHRHRTPPATASPGEALAVLALPDLDDQPAALADAALAVSCPWSPAFGRSDTAGSPTSRPTPLSSA